MSSVYVGIDLHKRVSQVAVLDERTGELMQRRVCNQDRAEWEEIFRGLGAGTPVALEATGNWMWLADLLEELDCQVHLAHPARVRLIAESRNKNDKVDAEALLMLLRGGWLPEAYLAPGEVRQRRLLLRLRQGLVHMRTELKNRLHALLARHNLQSEHTDLFGKAGRAYLEALALPEASAKCREVWLELLDVLEGLIGRVENWLYAHLEEDPRARILQTMPGVGKLTAYLLLAEIGPIDRFCRPEKLVSYAGLCPSTRASMDRVRHGRTSPAGRSCLKWALVESAHVAARCDPYFASLHARLRHAKGNGKSIVAVARQMTKIIWRMLKENRAYISKKKQRRIRVGSVAPVADSRS